MITRRVFLAASSGIAAAVAMPSISRAAPRVTLRLGHALPAAHPYHYGLVKFKEIVEARTNGAIAVEVYPSGQIGGELQILQGVSLGTVDGGAVAAGSIQPTYGIQRFNLLDMPYLFKDYAAVERFATGELGDRFRAKLPEEAGFMILGYGGAGFHQVLNRVRPVHTPQDLKGMKLRVWEAPGAKLALELMGANPTPMPFGETFTALQQGVVDGVTNSMTTLFQAKLNEAASNLSLTYHAYIWVPFVFSHVTFQSLGKEEQKIVLDAGAEATSYWRSLLPKDDAGYREKFVAAGTQVVEVDQAVFRDQVAKGYDRYLKIVTSPDARDLMAQLQAVGGF